MRDGSRTGCVVAAVMIAALGGIGAILLVVLNTRDSGMRAEEVMEMAQQAVETEQLHEKMPAEALVARKKEEVLPDYVVQLKDKTWPRYELRKRGAPLSVEEFVASRIDKTSTNLVKTVFGENSEGAAVRFQVKAINVYRLQGKLQGDFAVEYAYWKTGEKKPDRGSETVRCEFANTSENELLDIRRGSLVTVQGKFSMKTKRPMILEAVLVRESGE